MVKDIGFSYVEKKRKLLQDIRNQSIEKPDEMTWGFLEYEPSVQSEQVTGIRLTSTDMSEFLEQNGLEFGDVITAVNGSKIDSNQAVTNAMNTIGKSRHLELIVERGSENITVVIDK